MRSTFFLALLLVCLMLGIASIGQAGALVDEDFEGAAVLVNQNWIVRGSTTFPPTPEIIAVQGVHLRTYADDANNTHLVTYSATGSQTPTRFFQGAKSYKLDAGQAITFGKPADGAGIQAASSQQLIQFALSADASVAGKAVGTQVGHFKIDFSLTNTSTVQDSAFFNFVVAAGGKLSVVSQDNAAVIKTIDCGAGQWTLLSFAINYAIQDGVASGDPARNANTPWRMYDPLTTSYKGLQPIIALIPPANPEVATNFNSFGTGIQVFADANTTVTTVRANDMDPGWGLDGVTGATWETWIQGWELAAENGGIIYIDDLAWHTSAYTTSIEAWCHEIAARTDPFNTATTEPAGPPVAQVRHWDLY